MKPKRPNGKRIPLSTGLTLELWPPHPVNTDIRRIAILGERGGVQGVLSFEAADLPAIVAALREAVGQ